MGICTSSGGIEISEDDKQRHREAEKVLKEVSFRSRCGAHMQPHVFWPFVADANQEWRIGEDEARRSSQSTSLHLYHQL